MDVKYGVIQKCEWVAPGEDTLNPQLSKSLSDTLLDRKLHEVENWTTALKIEPNNPELQNLVAFFNRILPPQS
jgi:hypothetical protein